MVVSVWYPTRYFWPGLSVGNATRWSQVYRDEGMEAKHKREKNKKNLWYPTQGPGQMAHTPQVGTGDYMGRFRWSCAALSW